MRHRRATTLAVALLFALAAAALPARAGEIAVEGQAGYRDLAFSNTATALFGSTGGGDLRRRLALHVLARGLRERRLPHVLEGRGARLRGLVHRARPEARAFPCR